MIEETGANLRLAAERFAAGGSADESLTLTADTIREVLGMDPRVFVSMSAPSMVTLVEVSGLDDRLISRVAESLMLEADILQSEGDLLEAAARREQATAILDSIDPAQAN
jgi:hypothetical protein